MNCIQRTVDGRSTIEVNDVQTEEEFSRSLLVKSDGHFLSWRDGFITVRADNGTYVYRVTGRKEYGNITATLERVEWNREQFLRFQQRDEG